jgi:transcriptional regulator with XRE-family HTH domain
MKLRENIAFLLDRHRPNPHALASKCGVPQRTIHRILMGESDDPKTDTLAKIAGYFGLTPTDLHERDLRETDGTARFPASHSEVPSLSHSKLGDFAARLKAGRLRANLTQEDVATRLEVAVALINGLESG